MKQNRCIKLEGAFNFRDFGGYNTQNGTKIKTGLLYRSESLARLTNNDLNVFESLGIKVVCDLRAHDERRKEPDRIPNNSGIKSVHIPMKSKRHHELGLIQIIFALVTGKARKINFEQVLIEIYQEFVSGFLEEFSSILKLISDNNNLPILIHCKGGKDRTGFACALIQLLLDTPLELVEQDYLLTNKCFLEIKEEYLSRFKYLSIFGVSREKLLPFFEARKEYLETALNQIKKDYGTVNNYAKHGLYFSEEDKFELNKLLLEENN
jgi:protein-tyrosine phosphatase